MWMTMIAFTFIAYGIGTFFTSNLLGWTIGIILGLFIALLKLRLMKITLNKAMTMSEAKAKSYTQKHYFIRYGLTGILLIIATIQPNISLLGVFIGLFSMKIAAYKELWMS